MLTEAGEEGVGMQVADKKDLNFFRGYKYSRIYPDNRWQFRWAKWDEYHVKRLSFFLPTLEMIWNQTQSVQENTMDMSSTR